MIVDVRSDTSGYIEIGTWVVYIDNSTGERIIHSWDKRDNNEELREHTSMGTRQMPIEFHREYQEEKQNNQYIQDMLEKHKYRNSGLLLNSEGDEVRDLNGKAIFIDIIKRHHYKEIKATDTVI